MAVWKPLRTRLSNHVVRRWIVNGRPSSADSALVSFCFDDFYHSAAQEGAALLGGLAMQATYFAAGALMGRTLDGLEHFTRNDVAELSAAGHEIGCHTFNHVRIPDCPAL
ncbi:MAG: polysaccharide deacetylase family protein [Alphaproteobacteria bacterium]|nr:polysaccharide deacetylase family protein [Alphaproteobacteria bacterium]